jgi:hypothetical protein
MATSEPRGTARRDFLKTAGVLAVGTAAVGSAAACDVKEPTQTAADDQGLERVRGFDRTMLDAVAAAVLPESLGAPAIRAATDRFVAWADGYDPVAEEMHGYGYADIRYLPADPAPAWRAQLQALDVLAQKTTRQSFARLPLDAQRAVLSAALRTERGDRLPSPLGARHVALAVLAFWGSSAEAWNLALGAQVSPATCRALGDAVKRPLPLAGERA